MTGHVDYDARVAVAVVGASVAGLTAAWRLARAGRPVRVFEAQTRFRAAERTLIVTPAFLSLVDDPSELVLNRVANYELISARRSVRISLREPDIVLDRAGLLSVLVRQVQKEGGQVLFGHRLVGLHRDDSRVLLRFATREGGQQEVPACDVVGADGARSRVARAIGLSGVERVGLAQARVSLPSDLPCGTVRVWFDRSTTRFFYWLIPESRWVGALGVIAESPREARALLKRFLAAQALPLLEWQPAAEVPLFPLRMGRVPLGDGRVLLVGDAAAQVKATTVGGVVTGMRGGLAAVHSILHRTPYRAALRPLQAELLVHALVRRVLDGFTDEDYDRLLGLLNRRTLEVLGRYHRDGLVGALWRVLLSQPRWLALGIRALTRGAGSSQSRQVRATPEEVAGGR